jgi:hypothetical protein
MARACWSSPSPFVRNTLHGVAFAAALALSACSTRSASLGLDAGDEPPCNSVAQLGQTIPINVAAASSLVLPSIVPPDDTLIEGQFTLSAVTVYLGGAAVPGDSGATLRQTLEFQGDQLRSVTSDTSGDTRFVGTYKVRGGLLVRTDTCHSRDAGAVETARIQIDADRLTLVTSSEPDDAGVRTVLSVYQRLLRDR